MRSRVLRCIGCMFRLRGLCLLCLALSIASCGSVAQRQRPPKVREVQRFVWSFKHTNNHSSILVNQRRQGLRMMQVIFSIIFNRELVCGDTKIESIEHARVLDGTSRLVCDDRTFIVGSKHYSHHSSDVGPLVYIPHSFLRGCDGEEDAFGETIEDGQRYTVALLLPSTANSFGNDIPHWLDACTLKFERTRTCSGKRNDWPVHGLIASGFDRESTRLSKCLLHSFAMTNSIRDRMTERSTHRSHTRGALDAIDMKKMLLLARGGIDVALKMFRGSRDADEARQSDEPLDSFARRLDAISTSFIERSEIVLDSKTGNTDGDNPFSPDAMRRRKRKKIDGAISGLVEISGMLRGLAEGRTTLREGTIFEVIINPLINILSALMPEFLYIITKEMIVALIEYILEQLMLPVFTQPALASLVPPRAGAKPLLKKTCRKDRSIKCATDKDCADKKPCDTGKTCAKDRNVLCNTDADCKESPTSDLSPCNTGKTCAKDRSIECATDEECDDKAPCDTGKTCAKDRSIKCATDEECDDKAPCNTGKTCAKDRSIKCATDEECDDKAPCNNDTGKTCAKDRSIKCATDEECADKAPCDTGKTCAKDRSIKCATDEECDDKAPCNTGKTCAKDRSIECATDEECDDKAPCDTGKTCARDRSIKCATDEECDDKAPCNTGKTCAKDRSIKCATDEECDDKAPCNNDTGKTCAKDRSIKCATDEECADKAPCDTGKTCAKDRSIKCATDEECDDKAPCNNDTGKTCAKDRSIKCATDEECADKAPCDTGKTCAKDRSIKCATDEECDDKAPCNNDTGKTCAKDRSIKCATNEECADKAPCDTGKTCAKDRSIKCATDEECDDKAPCNTGKTCAKDRSIECASDEECGSKAPCNSGRIVRRRSRGFVDIFPTEATPSDGVIVSKTAYGSGDVGLDSTAGSVGKLSCENDCEEEEEESEENEGVPTHVASSNNPNGPLQPDADPPSAFAELETKHRAGPVPDVAANFDLAMMLTVSITDAVADDLSAAIRKRFDDFLGIRARQAIVRSSSRALTTRLTATLGSSLSRMLVELLTLSMTVVPTKKITAALIPSLTSSIVPVVTHALKHDPKSDYYCYYCLHERVYCDLCEKAELEIAFLDQQARYYSAYYSEYYSAHYSSDESAARDYFGRGRRAGNA